MARKKKKRKQRRSQKRAAAPASRARAEAAAVAAEDPSVAAAPKHTEAPEAARETSADPDPARAEAADTRVTSAPPEPVPAPAKEEIVADLDADLDDAGESYDSLVAAVAGFEDQAPAVTNGRAVTAEDDAEEILDLDADAEVAASVEKLIAQVERAAPPEERSAVDEDVPVIDLDDDAPPAATRRAPQPSAAATMSPEMERLARAAAAGAIDEPEPPPIPLDSVADLSTPEARARLLAEALAHAEHKEARYRVPLSDSRRVARLKSAVAAVLLVAAGTVAVAPPAWVRPQPPAQLTEAARTRGLRLALLLQAHQVEAYRLHANQLPESLDELPVRLDGVLYARSGRSYQLVAYLPDGTPIVYDAADPLPAFRELEAALAVERAP